MKKKIEQDLSNAVDALIPEDMFSRISQNIDFAQKERVAINMNTNTQKPKNNKKMWLATAAAVAIMALSASGIVYYTNNFISDSIVSVDINPSVELITNRQDKVLTAKAINEDGKAVLDGMDLKNVDINIAMNAVIGSMVKQGYFADGDNGILVTVQNDNAAKAEAIRNSVVTDIDAALNSNQVKASVINQTLTNNGSTDTKAAKQFAAENNISVGKAIFILKLAEKEPTLNTADMAKMNMRQLAAMIKDKNIDISGIVEYDKDDSIWENVEDAVEDYNEVDVNASATKADVDAVASPTMSNNDYDDDSDDDEKHINATAGTAVISAEKAKEIAAAHAGISAVNATFKKAKLDYENGIQVYEIEFYVGRTEYDYEINASNGEIVSYKTEED